MATAVEIVASRLKDAPLIVAGAKRAGLPLYVAAALVDMESEGENIYGGDAGGYFSQSPRKKVTEENFKEFYQKVVVEGRKSNGVGPMQITYNGRVENGKRIGSFFVDAKERGLKLWVPEDNYTYGFMLAADYAKQFDNDWFKVGRRYNGKDSYGTTFERVVGEWKTRLAAASEDEEAPVAKQQWYPAATKKEIKPGSNDPAITPIGAILHVDAGNTRDLYNYFNGPSGGIESHFQIAKDGVVFQYRGVGREADANYKGNSFLVGGTRFGYVSIETQGLASGEWTDAQLASIKKLLLWLREEWNIQLQVPKTSKSPGVGYHILFGAPGDWTPVAKSCPGPNRIKQYRAIIVPWMKSVMGGSTPTPPPAPTVDLSAVVRAAKTDPAAKSGTFTAKADVLLVEKALVAEGLLDKALADGHFGTATVTAYAKWQRSAAGGNYSGDDADGVPGMASLSKLGKRHNFKVVE